MKVAVLFAALGCFEVCIPGPAELTFENSPLPPPRFIQHVGARLFLCRGSIITLQSINGFFRIGPKSLTSQLLSSLIPCEFELVHKFHVAILENSRSSFANSQAMTFPYLGDYRTLVGWDFARSPEGAS
jgi:hypothetical protein